MSHESICIIQNTKESICLWDSKRKSMIAKQTIWYQMLQLSLLFSHNNISSSLSCFLFFFYSLALSSTFLMCFSFFSLNNFSKLLSKHHIFFSRQALCNSVWETLQKEKSSSRSTLQSLLLAQRHDLHIMTSLIWLQHKNSHSRKKREKICLLLKSDL